VQIKYRFKGQKKDLVLEMSTAVTIASVCHPSTLPLLSATNHYPFDDSAVASLLPSFSRDTVVNSQLITLLTMPTRRPLLPRALLPASFPPTVLSLLSIVAVSATRQCKLSSIKKEQQSPELPK
jgi:hypothetical protein